MTKSLLERLPTDIFFLILDLCSRKSIVRLSSCSRNLREWVTPVVYKRNVRFERSSAALWAILKCRSKSVSWEVIQQSGRAGTEPLTTQWRVKVEDLVSRGMASTLSYRMRHSGTEISPFAMAVITGRDDIICSWINQQQDESPRGHLPLDFIAALNSWDIVGILKILAGPDHDARSVFNWNGTLSPLAVASATGLSGVVRHISSKTRHLTQSVDGGGYTPLHYAVTSPLGTAKTVKELIRNEADIKVCFQLKGTDCSALAYACCKGAFEIARALLQYDFTDEMQYLLLEVLKTRCVAVRGRTKAQKRLLVQELIRRGADPNGQVRFTASSEARRPLIVDLAMTSRLGLEALLAIKGVNINSPDARGRTALTCVLSQEFCDPPTAKMLLQCGASLQKHSFDSIIQAVRFSTLKEAERLLQSTVFDVLSILYQHCTSLSERDESTASFLASLPPESMALLSMTKRDIHDIKRGKMRALRSHFCVRLTPKNINS